MKTRGLFLSALFMGAVFAGCSNEEFVDNGSEKSLAKSDNYIAVNIVAPSDAVSRGAEGGFVAGDPEENKVTDVWFVFFNDAGGYVGAVEGKLENWRDGNGSIEKISSAVIVSYFNNASAINTNKSLFSSIVFLASAKHSSIISLTALSIALATSPEGFLPAP